MPNQNALGTIREGGRLLQVRTAAKPDPDLLLKVRSFLQKDETTRKRFQTAAEGSRAEVLVAHFQEEWAETPVDALREVAAYLADEHQQVGHGVLLISSTTGRAIMHIQEKDVWQPPPVRRENGAVVQPTPRLQPALEGALVQWVFDTEREKQIVQELATRLPQTPLTLAEGDRRLLPVTRSGRKQLVDELRESLPCILKTLKGGVVQAFLDRVQVVETPLGGSTVGGEAVTKTVQDRVLLADLKSLNLHYDALQSVQSKVGTGWVRYIARALAEAAVRQGAPHTSVKADDLVGVLRGWAPGTLWVMPPDVASCCRDALDRVLVVEGSPVLGFPEDAGACCVVTPDSYTCDGRDIFERWEVTAGVTFQVYAQWERLTVLDVSEVPVSGASVETP